MVIVFSLVFVFVRRVMEVKDVMFSVIEIFFVLVMVFVFYVEIVFVIFVFMEMIVLICV